MNEKERNEIIRNYILDAIDASDYEETPETDNEKLQFVDRAFRAEYSQWLAVYGYNRAMARWLSGLPSAVNIDFTNSQILERGREWGIIRSNASTNSQHHFINNWFAFMANTLANMINQANS